MEIDDKDFKQLLVLLQKLVADKTTSISESSTETADEENESDSEDQAYTPPSNPVIKDKKSRSVIKKTKFVNKFLEMKEANMHKADIEIDKKLNKHPPTQRSRQYEPVEVQCRICGKKENVPPSLVESRDRYKCNNCSTNRG